MESTLVTVFVPVDGEGYQVILTRLTAALKVETGRVDPALQAFLRRWISSRHTACDPGRFDVAAEFPVDGLTLVLRPDLVLFRDVTRDDAGRLIGMAVEMGLGAAQDAMLHIGSSPASRPWWKFW